MQPLEITAESRLSHINHGEKITIDLTPVILGVLLAVTAVAAYEYYKTNTQGTKRIRESQRFVEDIVLSFNRELKRESDKFDTMVSKVEGSYTTADASSEKQRASKTK